MTQPDPILTIAQAAERLQVSQQTIRREIADGRLAAVSIRRLWRIREAALREYLRRLEDDHQSTVKARTDAMTALTRASADAVRQVVARHQVANPRSGVPDRPKRGRTSWLSPVAVSK